MDFVILGELRCLELIERYQADFHHNYLGAEGYNFAFLVPFVSFVVEIAFDFHNACSDTPLFHLLTDELKEYGF